MPNEKLYRSTTNRVIAGVCAGLADYFDIDPMVVRALFVLAFFMSGAGIVLYIVLWLIIPEHPVVDTFSRENLRNTVSEMKAKAIDVVDEFRGTKNDRMETRQSWLAILAIAIGIMLLLRNFDLLSIFNFDRLWPLILIVIGFAIMFKKR
ncbi:MAG: PspC domain-containing protein [bacterium]|nr:PspC domain-containing protein [bacterium]